MLCISSLNSSAAAANILLCLTALLRQDLSKKFRVGKRAAFAAHVCHQPSSAVAHGGRWAGLPAYSRRLPHCHAPFEQSCWTRPT